jgi:dTDP-4-amino-4,6-dideoxygalactose transaminase
MESIMELSANHNLFIVEDAAQATGADYIYCDGSRRKAGTIGHTGTTSFFPSKNLGCYGDGGALYTNDDALARKLRSISNHGMKIRYHHDDIGINSRLDTIQAAILRVKLKHLDEFNEARRAVAGRYDEAFASCSEISVPKRSVFSTHIFHQYTLKVNNGKRDELKKYLESKNIPAMKYYPGPLHTQEAYRYLGYSEDAFPVTSRLCGEVLSLPIHPDMDQDQLEYIIYHVLDFFGS